MSVCGRSKWAGEELLFARPKPCYLLFRRCGLCGNPGRGGKGNNFVEAALRQAREGGPLQVVGDQVCTPRYVADVTVATVTLFTSGASACTWKASTPAAP